MTAAGDKVAWPWPFLVRARDSPDASCLCTHQMGFDPRPPSSLCFCQRTSYRGEGSVKVVPGLAQPRSKCELTPVLGSLSSGPGCFIVCPEAPTSSMKLYPSVSSVGPLFLFSCPQTLTVTGSCLSVHSESYVIICPPHMNVWKGTI